ncbi:MAG TPA: molybdopterin cofactor-binding domain-containing protein [Candidatus Cybelea sp.]|nr:molybdopterin cofactor-binding domain-containing protein [Candidatus Cybelea sp.]
MSAEFSVTPQIEPERYELRAPSPYHFELRRRDFFRTLGAGLLVACVLKDAFALQESGGGRRPMGDELPREISAWLHIGENGGVTTYTGKVEIGQNIRTSLSQAVAEELRFPLARIEMVMGDTRLTPYDMGTFGSRTTPTMNLHLRQVAAAARDVLIDLAAKQWNADRSVLLARDGRITDPSTKRTIEYVELLRGQQLTELVPAEDPLEPPAEWTVEGKPVPKVDGRDFVTGKHKYPSDQVLPGMLHGKVLRPPSFGATLASVETPDLTALSGVTFVHDGNFVGVAGPSEETAIRALKSVRAEWRETPDEVSSKNVYDYLKENPAKVGGELGERSSDYELGAVDRALAAADHRIEQTYTVAYIAHAPLEPRAALAEWSGDSLTVWTGTQRPFGVRSELARTFNLPEENVHVLMPDMGSAYGGKHTGESAIEAARLARAANRPVRVVWTREEEFTWAYFRPAGAMEIKGGVQNDGSIVAWEFHNYNSGGSGIRTFYEIPNQRILFHPTEYPLRQGSYRALAATANHFARESFMDELAHEVKMDPLAFRLKNLKNERLRAVFEAAGAKFDWSRPKQPGHGFGIGGGFEKGGNVATCAEVTVDQASGEVHVVRVVTAFECGAIVNPDNLRNQIEGGNIMGLGGALFEAIQFENGKILNPLFSRYRVPRFSDIPVFETVLIDRKDIPSAGAGESPLMGVAPAIGNAIFDAKGVRLRSMPMVPEQLNVA